MTWLLVILASVGGLYLLECLFDNRRRLRVWNEAIRSCLVTDLKSSGIWTWWTKLTARSGPVEVRITDNGGDRKVSKVVIKGEEGLSVLKLRSRGLKQGIEFGDEEFDSKFRVEGPLRPAYARLDGTMRRLLLDASADTFSLRIGDGQLSMEVPEGELSRRLPLLLDIGRRLASPVSLDRQIAENALQDFKEGARLMNLLLLAREYPGDPGTLKVLRAACSDASPRVRLQAAIELGDEGREVLVKLAEGLEDDASCAQAVSHLGGKLPFERLSDILSRSLEGGHSETARSCLEELGHHGTVAIDVLQRVMTEKKGELATAAAVALGTTGEPAAEAPLLQALQSEDSDLREAAASALGRVGTAAAVQPLQEAAESSLFDLGLRRAARQAVAEIQSRREGASPGQLSLTDVEAGQLSLAPFEAGQLSLAPHETEQTPDALAVPQRPFQTDVTQSDSPSEATRRQRE